MKKKVIFPILLGLLFTLTACGTKQPANDKPVDDTLDTIDNTETPNETPDETVPESEPALSFSDSVNTLGYDLFARLAEGDSFCISPYSIETALGMGANAASDTTLTEMQNAMHISDINTFNQDFTASSDKLQKDALDIRIANSAWYDNAQDYSDSFETSYLPLLKDTFHADSFQTDLSDPSTVKSMNDWLSDATEGKITDMVSELPKSASLILFNAVYFNGEWEVPFSKDGTYEEAFNGTDGTRNVPFMHMSDKYFKYCEYKGLAAIRMNYKDSDMAMDILIPLDKSQDAIQLFHALSNEEKQELYHTLSSSGEVLVGPLRLPRFEFSSESIPLSTFLKDLGMTEAFTDKAKLDLISPDAYIDDIFHKTYIRVDEKGTEAAAATEMMISETSLPVGEPVSFEADVPFVYYISDTSDGTILFLGAMKNIEP